MSEGHSTLAGIMGFVAGCVLTALCSGIVVAHLRTNDKQDMSQSGERLSQLQGQVRDVQADLQVATQAKDACEAKFQRSTVLYDGILFQDRRWIIPADVEPIYLGKGRIADYTHLDLKTQTETIHMRPKQPVSVAAIH